MPTRQPYSRLPQLDDSELEAAFDDDEHDEHAAESAALIPRAGPDSAPRPGEYDFEPRFEDYASRIPDGSPPPFQAAAGNSNGVLPQGPPAAIPPRRPNWLTRTLSSFRRSQDRAVGRGNDGVFGNVVAKPSVPGAVHPEDDADVHVAPEVARSDAPPTYYSAMADPAPAYWAETVHADAPSINMPGELIVDDLPTGSIMMFAWATLVTTSFAWVGVFLAYLLNKTSHAGRHGSRAGLGLWFIRYGYELYLSQANSFEDTDEDWHWEFINGTQRLVHGDADGGITPATFDDMETIAFRNAMNGWMAILLLFIGSMVISISIGQFAKVKRYEAAVLASTLPQESTIRNISGPGRERPSVLHSLRDHLSMRFAQPERADDEEQIVGSGPQHFPGQGRRLDGQPPLPPPQIGVTPTAATTA
ncbi:hypothetical protein EXIGLDRAFT_758409 [Exidia glandulosa HHB12029]|uniref:Uncharacterized protein n=1 Tax=Exidia glandulosa HHB12029 TaxID=1314781 RepID=A0A165QUY4_EXIGL|nr:hypothetical protein EXIGLDRAFT_758409 [Exidia glandulosa HHB12029]